MSRVLNQIVVAAPIIAGLVSSAFGSENTAPARTSPEAEVGALKITIVQPALDTQGHARLVGGARLGGLVRVQTQDEKQLPRQIVLSFMRGRAFAGQFIAEPKRVNGNLFEYSYELKAPVKPGTYILKASPSRQTVSGQTSSGEEKYPKIEVRVVQ